MQVGDVQVSKVELLLKRAVVVKAEAIQLMAENLTAKQGELQGLMSQFYLAGRFDGAAIEQFQADSEQVIWRGFDRASYRSSWPRRRHCSRRYSTSTRRTRRRCSSRGPLHGADARRHA